MLLTVPSVELDAMLVFVAMVVFLPWPEKNYILVVSVVLREENQAVGAAIWLSAASPCLRLLPFLPLVQVKPSWQLWPLVESVPSVSEPWT